MQVSGLPVGWIAIGTEIPHALFTVPNQRYVSVAFPQRSGWIRPVEPGCGHDALVGVNLSHPYDPGSYRIS
jgi:hypothetical protein